MISTKYCRGYKRAVRLWVVTSLALIAGCVTNTEITIFDYSQHTLPRVSVTHSPIYPELGESVVFTATAELAANSNVQSMGVQRMSPTNTVIDNLTCSTVDSVATCNFSSAEFGDVYYRAFVTDSEGRRRYSPGTYKFQYGHSNANNPNSLPVRVPKIPNARLTADYRIDVLFIRDPSEGGHYDTDEFFDDITQIVNSGILGDPIYRWRDNQLAFHAHLKPGFTSSFYAGRDTACGQNPWFGESDSNQFNNIEVVAVLHRRTKEAGASDSVLDPSVEFRDCAGRLVDRNSVATFSTRAGLTSSPLIAKHEFGHAALGLGDEYYESQSSRQVFPESNSLDPGACCCRCDSTGPQTSGGEGGDNYLDTSCGFIDQVKCVGNGISIDGFGLSSCSADFYNSLPISCTSSSQGRCPPLKSECVLNSAWLGNTPPPTYLDEETNETKTIDPDRHNVFASLDACEDSREQAANHPGVEDEHLRLGECRQLCGQEGVPCPCNTPAAWIVDHIGDSEDSAHDDAMTDLTSAEPLHGGTCAWCVETSLCIRWQSDHLDNFSPIEVWETCSAPPKWIRHFNELVEFVLRNPSTIRINPKRK